MTSHRKLWLAALALAVTTGALLLIFRFPEDNAPPRFTPERIVTIVQDDAELLHREPRRIAATLDALRADGVDWVRITAGWSEIAPARDSPRRPEGFDAADPGAYEPARWGPLDRAVDMARRRGLQVNLDIAFWAPRWAVRRSIARGRERWAPDAGEFGAFAEAVARRYARRVVAFTLWNEPNHNVFLMPQWSAGRPRAPHLYRAMVQAAYPRVKRAAPRALVLVGATSSIGAVHSRDAGSRLPPLRFLRELACVDGRLRPLRTPSCRGFRPVPGDGWSHHPYGNDLPPWVRSPQRDDVRMADLGRLERLLRQLGERGRLAAPEMPIYVTEYGYQTNPPDPTRRFSPADQARFVAEAERIARSFPTVRATSQFLLRDLPERTGRTARQRWADYQSGLRFLDGTPKPAEALFAFPLVVRRTASDRVDVWALIRPGRGVRRVRVSVAERVLASGVTDGDGVFVRRGLTVADPGASFSLSLRGGDGRWRIVSSLPGAR